MTIDFDTYNNARSVSVEHVRDAPPDQVFSSLIAWLTSWERATYIDGEAISDVGLLISQANHVGLDRLVVDWLRNRESSKRREIAGSFLWGYWRFTENPDCDSIGYFRTALEHLSPAHEAYSSTLLALYAITISRGRQNVPQSLREAINTELLSQLDKLEQDATYSNVTQYLQNLRSTNCNSSSKIDCG
jgi:hypothetical protein